MKIHSRQPQYSATPKPPAAEPAFSSGGGEPNDTFKKAAKVVVGTGIAAAIGYGLGSAASGGGLGGGTVGMLTGAASGMFIASPMGDGKGADGLIYPVAGVVVGGIGGAVLGAFGGGHMPWVGAAAGGLAALTLMT